MEGMGDAIPVLEVGRLLITGFQCDGGYHNGGYCHVGYYNDGTQGICKPCEDFFCPIEGLVDQLLCGSGFNLGPGDIKTECIPCAPGKYCSTNVQALDCILNTYSFGYSGACNPCVGDGQVCSPTQQFNCPVDFHNANAQGLQCEVCPPGKSCDSRETMTDCYSEEGIPLVKTAADDSCRRCKFDSVCSFDKASEEQCEAGSIPDPKHQACFECAEDHMCPTEMRVQYRCHVGYASAEGSTSCSECPEGKYCKVGEPLGTDCGRGFYSPPTSSYCNLCPFFADCNQSNSGKFDAICQTGQYYDVSYRQCFPCKEGLYCPGGSESGLEPPYGYKIPYEGASNFGPTIALAGQKFDETGQVVDIDIWRSGTFSPLMFEGEYEVRQGRIDAGSGRGFFPPPGILFTVQGPVSNRIGENTFIGLYIRLKVGTYEIPREVTVKTGLYANFPEYLTPFYLIILTDVIFRASFHPGEPCPPNSIPNQHIDTCIPCPEDTLCFKRMEAIIVSDITSFYQPCPKFHTRALDQNKCSAPPYTVQWCPPNQAYSNIDPIPDSLLSDVRQECTFYDNFISLAIADFPTASGKEECAPNFYKLIGVAYCTVFLPGFYDRQLGTKNKLPGAAHQMCPLGFFCHLSQQGIKMVRCPIGSVGSQENKRLATLGCKVSQKGYYFDDNGEPKFCPPNHICPMATKSPIPCPPGFYYPQIMGKETCLYCVNRYCPLAGEGEMTRNPTPLKALLKDLGYGGARWRPIGRYWGAPVTPVGQMYYSDDTDERNFRTPCPFGTTNSIMYASSLLQCDRCTRGFLCNAAAQTPTACAKKNVCNPSFTANEVCLHGYKEVIGSHVYNYFNCGESVEGIAQISASQGVKCYAGFICPKNSISATEIPCPRSRVNLNEGGGAYTSCGDVSLGYYTNIGSNKELKCPTGNYCRGGVIHTCPRQYYAALDLSSHKDNCVICPPGKLCQPAEIGAPQDCPQGYYRPPKNVECTPIPLHQVGGVTDYYTQQSEDSFTIIKGVEIYCPSGFRCPPYTDQLVPCNQGFYCNDITGKTQCDATMNCATGGLIVPQFCPPNTYGEGVPGFCVQIQEGYYQLGDGIKLTCIPGLQCVNGDITPCPAGSISFDRLTCSQCPENAYCNAPRSHPCEIGFLCPLGSSIPEPCQPGTYGETMACSTCIGGYYCPVQGMKIPNSNNYYCEMGFSCEQPGNTVADQQVCPKGNYCGFQSYLPIPCKQGFYNAYDGATHVEQCLSCPLGKHCPRGTDIPEDCTAGHYCSGGSPIPNQWKVAPGYYSEAGSYKQYPCPLGYYQDQEAQPMCKASEEGYYVQTSTSISAKSCEAGYKCPEIVNYVPTPCQFGEEQPDRAQASCIPCTTGNYCPTFSSTPISCAAGYFCNSGAFSPTPRKLDPNYGPCAAGRYCVEGSNAGQPCPEGTLLLYRGAKTEAECAICPPGYKCTGEGIDSLSHALISKCSEGALCAPGTVDQEVACISFHKYCPEGSEVEKNCDFGQERESGLTCSDCQQGHYCENGKKIVCGAGMFCPTGSMVPSFCPLGFYIPSDGSASNTDCIECQPGQACYLQFNMPCDDLYVCPDPQTTSHKPVSPDRSYLIPRGYYSDDRINLKICQRRICNRVGVRDDDDPTLMACPDNYYCSDRVVFVNYPSSDSKDGGSLCRFGSTCTNGIMTSCPSGTYNLSDGGDVCHPCPGGFHCMTKTFNLENFVCAKGVYCPEGTKNEQATGIQSIDCPEGFVCPLGSHEPIVCPAGKIPDLTKTICEPCPAGYYCTPTRSAANFAILCPAGAKCVGQGNTHPSICPPGTYQPSQGQEECLICDAGHYCKESGLNTLGPKCPQGMYCAAGSSTPSFMCEEGYYCPAGSDTQIACPYGKFCQGVGLGTPSGNCWAGYYCLEKSTSPNPTNGINGNVCDYGYYCTQGTQQKQPCPVGTYNDRKGAGSLDECLPCPPGYLCETSPLITPSVQCDPGMYCINGQMQPCPVGYKCPNGELVAMRCQPGTYQELQGQAICNECPPGFFCYWGQNSDIIALKKCSPGYYCDEPGLIVPVKKCPLGTFSYMEGNTSILDCLPCPQGKYCAEEGLTKESGDCQDGFLCPEGSIVPNYPDNQCPQNFYCIAGKSYECPPATYTYGTGSTRVEDCIHCDPGKMCAGHTPSEQAPDCPAGYICPGKVENLTGASSCPAGHYCPIGSKFALKCPIREYQDEAGKSTCKLCLALNHCPVQGATAVTPCPDYFICQYSGQSTYEICQAGLYKEPSKTECTPCPRSQWCWPDGQNDGKRGECQGGWVCQGGADNPRPHEFVGEIVGVGQPQFYSYNGLAFKGHFTRTGEVGENMPCTQGYYSNTFGSTSCKVCPEGFYCQNERTQYPIKCAAGLLCSAGLVNPQGACEDGKYCESAAKISHLCPEGQLVNTDQTGCVLCPSGYFCFLQNGVSVKQPCIVGSRCSKQGLIAQPICPPGTFFYQGQCQDCLSTYFCVDGTLTDKCYSGHVCRTGSDTPTPAFSSKGYPCPMGFYCLKASTSGILCPGGTFSLTTGAYKESDCLPCRAGFICAADNPIPQECQPGHYCPFGTYEPTPCEAGTYVSTSKTGFASDCLACSTEFYCPNPGTSQPIPCAPGMFCNKGSKYGTPCPPGTYYPSERASVYQQCSACPVGTYCPEGSTQPLECSGGIECSQSEPADNDPCSGGMYCNASTKYREKECPVNHYCPIGTGDPILCVGGQVCTGGTEVPQLCPPGQFTEWDEVKSHYVCKDCPAGTYSQSFGTSFCTPCSAGFICPPASSSPYPIICEEGHYCPTGSAVPTGCPVGTYNPFLGAATMYDCIRCPVGAFSEARGSPKCKECGAYASSREGDGSCFCLGRYRAFQKSDSSCRCMPGYRPAFGEEPLSTGDSDCEPIMEWRCQLGQFRNILGECQIDDQCASECDGHPATRSAFNGLCYCAGHSSLDFFCNYSCRSSALQGTSLPLDDPSDYSSILILTDPVSQNRTQIDMKRHFRFLGTLGTSSLLAKGGKVLFAYISSTGSVFGHYGPPPHLNLNYRNLQIQRGIQTTANGGVPNAVLCLNQGDSLLWEIESTAHYPVYVKDSLLNTDFEFDYGPFLELETEMKSFRAQFVQFDTPYYFAYTFQSSAGTYMIGDSERPLVNNIIVKVMAESETCDNTELLAPRTPESLAGLGVDFRSNIFVYSDLWQIFVAAVLLCLVLFMIVCGIKSFQEISWHVPRPRKAYYRERQRRANIKKLITGHSAPLQSPRGDLSKLIERDTKATQIVARAPFATGMADEFEQEMDIETERQLHTPEKEERHKKKKRESDQEEDDLDQIDLGVAKKMQLQVAKVLKLYKHGHQHMFDYRRRIMEVLDSLNKRVIEIKVGKERAAGDQVYQGHFMREYADPTTIYGASRVAAPPLHAKHDVEELQGYRLKQKEMEEHIRERLKPVLDLHPSRLESLQTRLKEAQLAPIERERFMLEMDESDKVLVEIQLTEGLKQEVELRRLIELKAQWRRQRIEQVIYMIERVERGERLASVQELINEITVRMPDRCRDTVDLQIDREKAQGLNEITGLFHQKRSAPDLSAKELDEIDQEEKTSRVRLIKACEAKRKMLLFQQIKQYAREFEMQQLKVEALLNEMMAPSDLRDLNMLRMKQVKELVNSRKQHSDQFTQFHKAKERELIDHGVVCDREVEGVLKREFEQKEREAEMAHTYRMEEIYFKREKVLQKLEEAKNVENQKLVLKVEEELVDWETELEKEKTRNREQFEHINKERVICRVVMQEERMSQKRLKVERSLIEEACGLVRREEKMLQRHNEDQVQYILRRMIKEHQEQTSKFYESGFRQNDVEIVNSVGDILKITETLWFKLMAEELGAVLSRQQIEKELVIASIRGNVMEEKFIVLESEKMKLELQKSELRDTKIREKWKDEVYFEEYKNSILEYENRMHGKMGNFALKMHKEETRALRNLEEMQASELTKLRDQQLENFVKMIAKAFDRLHQRQLAPYYHYLAVPREEHKSTQVKEIKSAQESYKKLKEKELKATVHALSIHSASIQDSMRSKLNERYYDYAEMLQRLTDEERMIRVKREDMSKAVGRQKENLAKEMREVTQITKQQRDELVQQHEETVKELEKALLVEQKRQQLLMSRLKEKKRHQTAYQEQYQYFKYQENVKRVQRIETEEEEEERPGPRIVEHKVVRRSPSPQPKIELSLVEPTEAQLVQLKLPLNLVSNSSYDEQSPSIENGEIRGQLKSWGERVKRQQRDRMLQASSRSRKHHKQRQCGDLLQKLSILEHELQREIDRKQKKSSRALLRSESYRE